MAVYQVGNKRNGIIYMFSIAAPNGALGGRSGADQRCVNANNLPGSNVRAFISVNSSDEIRDMPSNYVTPTDLQILSNTHNKVADDWADLMDGTIDMTLSQAGVLPSGVSWLSGSQTLVFGSMSVDHCGGWTNTFDYAGVGFSDYTNSSWMGYVNHAVCSVVVSNILCLVW